MPPPNPPNSLSTLLGLRLKRKVYFSFHFDDILRVNNVRNAWKISHPDAPANRSFYDSSLWEARKLDSPDSVKNLVRDGVGHTSCVCVLVGTHTWYRRWVRYEIARAVIDGRGLLAVHLNSLRHHSRQAPDILGLNPLDYMAVGKVELGLGIPRFYLFEWKDGAWERYDDHTNAVDLPPYLVAPAAGYVTRLSAGTALYDYVRGEGHKNIGGWIDVAARRVGR